MKKPSVPPTSGGIKWSFFLRRPFILLKNIFLNKIMNMGHIKEPPGIDFVVDPTPLTIEERKKISEVIAYYKATGKKMALPKPFTKARVALAKGKKAMV